MTRTTTRTARTATRSALLLLPAAVLAMAGCSAEVSAGSGSEPDGEPSATAVAQDDLEQQVTESLTEEVGQAPDDVSCPGDLEAEVDATIECTLTAGADELPVTVTVTSVEGTQVDFTSEVGQIEE